MVVEVAQEHNETHGRLDISQHTPVPNSVLRMLLESINGENESIESKFTDILLILSYLRANYRKQRTAERY